MNQCRYCNSEYSQNREHVFPYGLGGKNIYVDFVCHDCNNKFSNLETELYQKSVIALERSVEGIEGYNPNKEKPSPLKAVLLLVPDEVENVVYEGGQFHEVQVYLRPQFITINNKFYLEGDSNESIDVFFKLIHNWRKSSLCAVSGGDIRHGHTEEYFEFSAVDEGYLAQRIYNKIKVKNEIRIDILPETHNIHNQLTPRLFLDDRDSKNNRLRVRARNIQEAIDFLKDFLTFTSVKRHFDSFPKKNLSAPLITVGLSWDEAKLERALVKIGMNCLMHYFPKSQRSEKIEPLLEYVSKGTTNINAQLDKKNNLIDTNPKTHNLFFYQMPEVLSIRISLFDGRFVFNIFIPSLIINSTGTYYRLVIDYKRRLNRFENQNEFLTSFSQGEQNDIG